MYPLMYQSIINWNFRTGQRGEPVMKPLPWVTSTHTATQQHPPSPDCGYSVGSHAADRSFRCDRLPQFMSRSNCRASRRKPLTRYAYSAFSSASWVSFAFSRRTSANLLHSTLGFMA